MNKKPSTREILTVVLLAVTVVLAITGTILAWSGLSLYIAIIFFSVSGATFIGFIFAIPKKRKNVSNQQENSNEVRYEPDNKEKN